MTAGPMTSNIVMSSLFSEQYDYPCTVVRPRVQLMIASVPRSGSTAFCNDLWNTGILGAPMEYLNLKWVEQNGRWREDLTDLMEYWRKVQSVRTSPNGLFSYKMFVPNYFSMLERRPALLESLTPTHVVYFTRTDVVAQAVSYARAIETQHWFNGAQHTDLEYDKKLIDDALAKIVEQKSQWEKLFERTGATDILRLSYEDYLRDSQGVIRDVIRFTLGSDEGRQDLGIPPIDIQRDISSFQWAERYVKDCGSGRP